MPKKDPKKYAPPTLVTERLRSWGQCVRKQRIAQKIRSADLCVRLGISHPTLSRLERGEPAVSAATFLAALQVLGVFDMAAPPLAVDLWQMEQPAGRSRPAKLDSDGYF